MDKILLIEFIKIQICINIHSRIVFRILYGRNLTNDDSDKKSQINRMLNASKILPHIEF